MCIREIGFRSEEVFGEGYRDAASVMAHEVFELGNSDILETLTSSFLKGNEVFRKLHNVKDEDSGVLFFKEVLEELSKVCGKEIKFCIWLCDQPEDVVNEYNVNLDSLDVYIKSDVILSDLGTEGKLYGYEEMPKPL